MADQPTQPNALDKAKAKPSTQPVVVARRGAVAKKKNSTAFDALADSQRIFVLEYLSSYNATKSAIKAGYSEKSARALASQLLSNVNIQAALEEEQAKRSKELRVDASRLIEEESLIAFSDAAEACDPETGELLPPHRLPEHLRRNLQGIDMDKIVTFRDDETTTTYKYKYRFGDKGRALERIEKLLGLYIEKHQVEIVATLADRLQRARSRIEEK